MLVLTLPLAKTDHWQPKSTISAAFSTGISFFHPFPVASGPHHPLTAFKHQKPFFTIAEVLENLHFILFHAEL
jgi:hypothetical protein